MNESMECMAFQLPVVAFDLHETRIPTCDVARPGVYQRLTGGPKALDRTAEV